MPMIRMLLARLTFPYMPASWTTNVYENAVVTHQALLSKAWVSELHKRGVSVIVFGPRGTLDTPAEWAAVRDAGAHGICSDYPTLALAWLARHPLRVVDAEL